MGVVHPALISLGSLSVASRFQDRCWSRTKLLGATKYGNDPILLSWQRKVLDRRVAVLIGNRIKFIYKGRDAPDRLWSAQISRTEASPPLRTARRSRKYLAVRLESPAFRPGRVHATDQGSGIYAEPGFERRVVKLAPVLDVQVGNQHRQIVGNKAQALLTLLLHQFDALAVSDVECHRIESDDGAGGIEFRNVCVRYRTAFFFEVR